MSGGFPPPEILFPGAMTVKKREDLIIGMSIMPDLDPPTLGDTAFWRRRGGQELILTLPYLSSLKFVGRLSTGILS